MNGKTPTLISGHPSDDEVTGKGEAEGTGQHVAVRGTDHRPAQASDELVYPRVPVQSDVLADRRGVAGERLQVTSSGEDPVV